MTDAERIAQLDAAVSRATARILELEAKVEGLLAILTDIEWQGGDNTIEPHCTSCSAFEPSVIPSHPYYANKYGIGHHDWCELALALRP